MNFFKKIPFLSKVPPDQRARSLPVTVKQKMLDIPRKTWHQFCRNICDFHIGFTLFSTFSKIFRQPQSHLLYFGTVCKNIFETK
jgi:hypothetical protein